MDYKQLKLRTNAGCSSGSSDKFYHWGGLLASIAIDNAQSDG